MAPEYCSMWTSTCPNSVASDVQIDRSGVVHVEGDRLAVRHHQTRVADRAVGRGPQRDDHHVEIALGAADGVLDGVGGLEEPVEAELLEFTLEVGYRIVRQQHDARPC